MEVMDQKDKKEHNRIVNVLLTVHQLRLDLRKYSR